jgi:hypothetical protein
MKVIIVKEVMTCDVLPVAMFLDDAAEVMFININKGAIQRGQQDKGLKHNMCTGPGHVGGPTWLQEAADKCT